MEVALPTGNPVSSDYRMWMVTKLEIMDIDGSAVLFLPETTLRRLNANIGDHLSAVETPNGIELVSIDPEFEQQMKIAGEIMKEDFNLLRRLAD